MNHRTGILRRHAATIAVFLIAVAIVLAGPGSPGGSIPKSCKDEDITTAVAIAWLCGNPFESSTPTQCSCLALDIDDDAPALPLQFEWNLGQADAKHDFVTRGQGGMSVYLSANEAVVEVQGSSRKAASRLTARLNGSRATAEPQPLDPLEGRVNYLLGADPKNWITNVPTFRRVKYRNVYQGVDLVYYGHGRNLEHDFVVSAGADPNQIQFQFEGADRVTPNTEGDLTLQLGDKELLWKKPVVYQTQDCGARKRVEARYRMAKDGKVGFELGAYDPKRVLVIDPEIQFATYLGRARTETATRVAVDDSGNVYATGGTIDDKFPITPGAFRTGAGASDRNNVMISKFRADGSALVYSTFIGGQSSDLGLGIAADASGSVYVTGFTASLDFPTTSGSLRTTPGNNGRFENENGDCFLLKLNPSGSALTYSTYIGGQRPDMCTALAVDRAGNAYVTGATSSGNFPTSEDAFQRQLRLGLTHNGLSFDGFLAKVNPAGSALVYGTLFGGAGTDIPASVAIDSQGNAYVAGMTNSNNGFPTSQGALQTAYKQTGPLYQSGVHEAFVVKFDAAAKNLVYGTYLGGGANDLAFGISVDGQGNAYVCGSTESRDFPTVQAFQPTYRGGGSLSLPASSAGDAFAAKLNPTGTALLYSTFLGGASEERAFGCVVDATGALHITGYTRSLDFPVSTDASQRTFGGAAARPIPTGDGFYTKLHSSGGALVYSSYFGGAGDEVAFGLALDAAGTAYLSGGSSSLNLPTTPQAVQRGYSGGPTTESYFPFGDAFVVKWGERPRPVLSVSGIVNAASFAGGAVAPGEWVVISGVGIGPATAVPAPEPDLGGRLPLTLAGTRVLFEGKQAPLVSVSAREIIAIVPFGVGAADPARTQLVVEFEGNQTAAVPVTLAAAVPALYTANSMGVGQASVKNEDGSANSAGNPAAPGSIVTLFGTGGGATEPASTDGEVPTEDFPPLAAPVTILIGETAVEEIFFSGGVKGRAAGIFQSQFRLPLDLPAGNVALTVRIGDAASQNGVTIAIAPAPAATAERTRRSR